MSGTTRRLRANVTSHRFLRSTRKLLNPFTGDRRRPDSTEFRATPSTSRDVETGFPVRSPLQRVHFGSEVARSDSGLPSRRETLNVSVNDPVSRLRAERRIIRRMRFSALEHNYLRLNVLLSLQSDPCAPRLLYVSGRKTMRSALCDY